MGFRFVMTYVGSKGYVMSGAGIDACWETVYAENSMTHRMTGHAYSRALVAHLFTTASLMSDLLRFPGALKGVDINHLKVLFESLP